MNQDLINEINELNNIHLTWKDYCLFLLNSSPKRLRDPWREKLITGIVHSKFFYNSLFESHFIGLEIMSELPNDFTEFLVDDYFVKGQWEANGRLSGSKKIKVKLGKFPQNSIDNEANICLNFIIDNDENFNKYFYLIEQSRLLSRIWEFSQKYHGNCIYPDEILTYSLEKTINDKNDNCYWIDVAEDIFENGLPSNKFKKYYYSDKINKETDVYYTKYKHTPIENFKLVIDKILKEDILGCPSWKKICICILKNDITFSYAGFAPSYKEKLARQKALEAFDKKFKNKNKSI